MDVDLLATFRPAVSKAMKARRVWRAFLCPPVGALLLLGALVCPPAAGAERTDFRVNDFADSAQADPRIAVAPDGSFAIVWKDRRQSQNDIYLQRFDTAGVAVGPNRRINDDTLAADQNQPALAAAHTGTFSSVWLDYRQGYPTNPHVYLQRFDDTLAPLGANVPATTASTFRDAPDVALSAWGKGIVVWSDYRNGNWDIYGLMLDADGNPIGSSFRVNSDVSDSAQHAPRVASSALGWFVVAWQDKRFGNNDIFVQRFDSSGARRGANVKVNTDPGTTEQLSPDVATDGAGRFTVVWTDYRNGPSNPDIYAARFDTSMTPLTANLRLNTDNSTRQQLYPSIAADRMGNVAVIWSDFTTSSSWDIVGQMIDVDGVVQEANFAANTFTDSMQYRADVALDGVFRYVTWMDRREDINYDIYASITRYNDPGLVTTPAYLEFSMRQGGPAPPPQYVTVQDVGYNRIDFEAAPYSGWLTVTPSTGRTPDSVAVSIGTTSLANGVYDGAIRIIDPVVTDSTVIIPVRLVVASAVLTLSTDSVEVTVPEAYDTTVARNVAIGNSGLGSMVWTATESADWLSLAKLTGSAPDELTLLLDPATLSPGLHSATVLVEAGLAENSPDSVVVTVTVRDDLPVLAVSPEEIVLTISDASAFSETIDITTVGGGELAWSLSESASWLNVSRTSGTAPSQVDLSLSAANLTEGLNSTTVNISAPSAYNSAANVTLHINYQPPIDDTLAIGPLTLLPGQSGVTTITAKLHRRLTSLVLPLQYAPELLSVDSIRFDPSVPVFMDRYYRIEPSAGAFVLQLDRTPPDMAMDTGSLVLASVYLTAGPLPGGVMIDAFASDTLAPLVRTLSGDEFLPVVQGALVRFDLPTDAADDESPAETGRFALLQNYPNPFNSETVVSFEIPRSIDLRLEVFNVLGRRVALLARGKFSSGRHSLIWSGRDESGGETPSGVYFYRLQTPDTSLVAKMILVK